MKDNEKILKQWLKTIEKYPKLNLSEAKVLYSSIKNDTNEIERRKKREKLIMGTLYIVCGYINKDYLYILNNNSYDMDDIINTYNEVWIEILDSCDLLKIKSFYQLFNAPAYTKITSKLNSMKIDYKILNLNKENLGFLLYNYIKKSENKGPLKYEDFINFLLEEKVINKNNLSTYFHLLRVQTIYVLFEEIRKIVKNENIIIKKYKLNYLSTLLIDKALNNLNKKGYNKIEDISFVEEKIYKERLLDIIFNQSKLTDIEKDIIKRIYGFNYNESKSHLKVAEEKGITKGDVFSIEMKAIRKLYMSKELRNYVNK